MSSKNKSRLVRDRLVSELRRELMGPSEPDETIKEYPTARYKVGRLAPAPASEDDHHARIDPDENESFGVGAAAADDENEDEDTYPPLIIGFNPSSMGLSFLVEKSVRTLRVQISWGDYLREKSEDGADKVWKRYSRECLVDGLPIIASGLVESVQLSSSGTNSEGVVVSNIDDPEVTLEGVVSELDGYKAVSLFLVNRRTRGDIDDQKKDERWIYQPKLTVSTVDNVAVFVAKDIETDSLPVDHDVETVTNDLLYRHAREFATGHGVAVGWSQSEEDDQRATSVFTEFIPTYEVPTLIAQVDQTGGAVLDMRSLAQASDSTTLVDLLEPMATAYAKWIEDAEREYHLDNVQNDSGLNNAAEENLIKCRDCASRIRAGLELLKNDEDVFKAFCFANFVMWDQRIHSLWAAENKKQSGVKGTVDNFDKPENRTWRPFQIGFILLNLCGVALEESDDRRKVDLLWFPTGGGKTEAYLGLAAFALGLRRLRGDRYGMHAGAGVSIIMRYTLRLLTVQQFQRAAALICACEAARRGDPETWGEEPFRIGIWVGYTTTPNTFKQSKDALDSLKRSNPLREGSPVQLVACPRCGTALVNNQGIPKKNTYMPDTSIQRTIIRCPNLDCEFSDNNSHGECLPVVVVDDEIYRTCPSLLVATVDKFARLPFKGETQSLFGLRNRYSKTYGHITEAHGDKVGTRNLVDAVPADKLLPPELIIQDELHLISGPLGTMVGLYETAIDYATSLKINEASWAPSKVIASTATIRRAAEQTKQLYARNVEIFPPPGTTSRDSFFAQERNIDQDDDNAAGRLYVGINAPGSTTKTLLVRVYSILLAASRGEIEIDSESADAYGTLVGYFNSLRALGGARRLVEDDVRLIRLKYLTRQRGMHQRYVNNIEELTSRLESTQIPQLLEKLNNTFPGERSSWPVDVLLATNMISVGVDIDRLGLMAVTGQPKTTAEYIQATSRVGRKYPGLVVTMYNWMGARDRSHYERFKSYHSALYRHVEAISVTPFSSRALDRGLHGIFAAMNRLLIPQMAREEGAKNFDQTESITKEIVERVCMRAGELVGKENAELVNDRLASCCDDWERFAKGKLRYSRLGETRNLSNSGRVLLQTAGTQQEGEWKTLGSLREVESMAAFFLDEDPD